MFLISTTCRWCCFAFYICRSCWRGQAYCCGDCRRAGTLRNKKKAQQKYRKTEKGKKQHREAENRRRYRKNRQKTKNMDDTPSTVLPVWCTTTIIWFRYQILGLQIKPCCRFCCALGQVVMKFPRRGYG